jgi:hypothetical protein
MGFFVFLMFNASRLAPYGIQRLWLEERTPEQLKGEGK